MKKIIINNEATINAEGKFNSNHCKPIVCTAVDGSEIRSFSSVADAAEVLGINANYISTCMNAKKPCKGYRFCSTKDVTTIMNEIMAIVNNNADDAKKWRAQKEEEERTRFAKEKYEADVENAKDKVARRTKICERLAAQLAQAEKRKMEAEIELETLLDNNQQVVA